MMTGGGRLRVQEPDRSDGVHERSAAIRSRRWSRSIRSDPDILVAGGADSGVFISTNGGTRWQLVTDPIAPGTSGVPHIPRPYYAHFDHDPPGGDINLFLGTRGRGVWRLTFKKVRDAEIHGAVAADLRRASVSATISAGYVARVQHQRRRPRDLGDHVVESGVRDRAIRRADSRSRSATTSASRSRCRSRRRRRRTRNDHLTITSNDPNFPTLTSRRRPASDNRRPSR